MTCVSVIVPAFNQADYLESALESVRRQSADDWECIIINDGSTDGTQEVIERYKAADARFRCVSQNNRGVSAARNLGLKMAEGKYVLFLDADDTIHRSMSELLVGVLEEDESADVAYGGYDLIDIDGNVLRRSPPSTCRDNRQVQRLLISNLFPINAAISRRTTVVGKGVWFPEGDGYEDWAFWLQMALEGARFRSVEGIVCSYRRQHRGRSSRVMQQTPGAERFLERSIHTASIRYGVSRRFAYIVFASLYLRRYLDAVEFEDDQAARYCRRKLAELKWLRLVGVSGYHVYLLGLYLDIQEATHELAFMEPVVLARKLVRRLMRSHGVGRGYGRSSRLTNPRC